MWYALRDDPALPPLAEGYGLREFSAGDEPGWAGLLDRNGQLGRWDVQRVKGEMAGSLVRQFFALCDGEIVACAGVYRRQRDGRECWEIGWIASDPNHSGKGLGLQVTAAAVAHAQKREALPIYLLTDDHRLPALKTYLKVGFAPDLGHDTYAARWRRIFDQLGDAYAEYQQDFERKADNR